jgi:hypothetical protein
MKITKKFIDMISRYLQANGQTVKNCDGGGDTQIVKTALDYSSDDASSCTGSR